MFRVISRWFLCAAISSAGWVWPPCQVVSWRSRGLPRPLPLLPSWLVPGVPRGQLVGLDPLPKRRAAGQASCPQLVPSSLPAEKVSPGSLLRCLKLCRWPVRGTGSKWSCSEGSWSPDRQFNSQTLSSPLTARAAHFFRRPRSLGSR